VRKAKKKMTDRFDCDIIGNMNEYVGCKIERDWKEKWIRFTQPVLLQSYTDEFSIPADVSPTIPAEGGQLLVPCKPADGVRETIQGMYRSGVGKLLHMMRWSRPEILNSVRELSRHMQVASPVHIKALFRVLKYCSLTPDRGLLLKPNRAWDGSPDHKFAIRGFSDANYATDTSNRRSISGYSVFLEGAPVSMKCGQQTSVTLSVTEAELVSATQCAQDMLFVMRVLESIGLQVEKPMILKVDNKGAVDLANNWSIGGRTRHIEVRQYFLRDLKMDDIIRAEWIEGASMSSDIFTKNLHRPLFEKHMTVYCGTDKYMKGGHRGYEATLKGRVSERV
jgi:hypothetical protein